MVLLLVFMQLTRDLFAIAKFLLICEILLLYYFLLDVRTIMLSDKFSDESDGTILSLPPTGRRGRGYSDEQFRTSVRMCICNN